MQNHLLQPLDIVFLVLYAVICLGIGIYASRKQKDNDYLIAGRKLGYWGFTFSILASYIGGSAIVAYSAFVYKFGISALSMFMGTAVGFLIFISYAKKIRKLGKEKEFITLSDWFFNSYNKKTGLVSALIMFFVYFGLLTNQFVAGSSILAGMSGWSYDTSLIISGSVILSYLILGGFRSVVKTDIFQYIVLIVLFVLFIFLMFTDSTKMSLNIFNFEDMSISMTFGFVFYGVLSVFFVSEYWQRVYAANDDTVIKKGLMTSAWLIIITGFLLSMIGLYAKANLPGIASNDALAFGLRELLPKTYIGLGLILIFAAIMSSADTMIFVLATSLAKDFFVRFGNNKFQTMNLAKLTRIFIILISLFSMISAYFFRDIVAVVMTISGVGFAIIPPLMATFHWKIKSSAALAALITGSVYVFVLVVTGNIVSELAVASFLVSAITMIIVQKFAKPEKDNKLKN